MSNDSIEAARYPIPTKGRDGVKRVNVRKINPTCEQMLVNSTTLRKSIRLCANNTTENEFENVRIKTDMKIHKNRRKTSNSARFPILNIDGDIHATNMAIGSKRRVTNATPNRAELNVTLAAVASARCKSNVRYLDIELLIDVNKIVM